jgi:hypothetical protein
MDDYYLKLLSWQPVQINRPVDMESKVHAQV